MIELQYPTGKFSYPNQYDEETLKSWIKAIQIFPHKLKALVKDLSESELKKTYRPEGWTIKQVIHHCADSHMNAYIRIKLALTEENPTIKPYKENLWAQLPDSDECPIGISLEILEGVHHRWLILLNHLQEKDWIKTYNHPESGKITSLRDMTALYAWHCGHHLAHIELALGLR